MDAWKVCVIGRCAWADVLQAALEDSGFETTRCQEVPAIAQVCRGADVVCMAIDFEASTRRCSEAMLEVTKLASKQSVWLAVRKGEHQAALIPIHRSEVALVHAQRLGEVLSNIIEARACEVPEADNALQVTAIRQRRETLTPRERQVMDLVVLGKLNKQIAAELELSPKTIEVHRASVMQKMQCGSLAGLVRCAVALESAYTHMGGRAMQSMFV